LSKILEELNKMKQDKEYGFNGYRYLGKFSSTQEVEEYVYKDYGIDSNNIRLASWPGLEDIFVVTLAGVKQFIKDFNLDESSFSNRIAEMISDLDEETKEKLSHINIIKYLDLDKTKRNFRKKFDLIRLDKDDYFINDNDSLNGNGNIYILSSDNIDEDIKKYQDLERIFTPEVKLEKFNLNVDDEIGDTIDTGKRIDLGDRDLPFIYVNGEISIGKTEETHSNLLNKRYNIYIDDFLPVDDQEDLIENIDKQFELKSFGAGQIIGNVAIIDSVTLSNCTEKEVADALIKEPSINKVYITDDRRHLTRLAKLIRVKK